MFFCNSPELALYTPNFSKAGGGGRGEGERGVGGNREHKGKIDLMENKKIVFDVPKNPIVTNLTLQKLYEQCPFSSH